MQVFRAIWLWLQVAGGTLAVVAVGWLAAQFVFHLRLLDVQTGSMVPVFRPHDALIMQQTSGEPRIGTIVSYKSARNSSELVTHRVVAVFPASHSFQAKGDQLSVPDPVVRNSRQVGRVIAVLPGMGRLLNWLQTWQGLVVCVYLPTGAIVVSELYRFEQAQHSKRLYRLNKAQVV